MKMSRQLPLVLTLTAMWGIGAGYCCTPWVAVSADLEGPVGNTSNGVLVDAVELSKQGPGYAFYHNRDRRYGSKELAGLIERVALKVQSQHDGATLRVGDMSGSEGGKITGHQSHRTGLDVDLAFFVQSPAGAYTKELLLAHHDSFGAAVEGKKRGVFDMEKNWTVIEALLTDKEVDVQWIFVSSGLKAQLLRYALRWGRDISIVYRAASVLHQPGDSAIHDDHFHVRIYCPHTNKSIACIQRKPIWPWIGKNTNYSNATTMSKNKPVVDSLKTAQLHPLGFSDEQLVDLALEGI